MPCAASVPAFVGLPRRIHSNRHETDVRADGERAIEPDVAGAGGCTEDHADQAEREHCLVEDRRPIRDASTGLGSNVEDAAVGQLQEDRGLAPADSGCAR